MQARALRPMVDRDYGEVFTLQRATFVDEARVYCTPFVPALDETFEPLSARLDQSTSWVALLGSRIVGAVSLRSHRLGGPDMERLMVAPDCRRQGIASVLLQVAEDHAASAGQDMIQLMVGDAAKNNREMYEHLGWIDVLAEPLADFPHVIVRTMNKQLPTPNRWQGVEEQMTPFLGECCVFVAPAGRSCGSGAEIVAPGWENWGVRRG